MSLPHYILAIVHFVYSIYLVISAQWALVKRQFRKRFSRIASGSDVSGEWNVGRIKKLPGHLVVVVGYEDISFVDLAKIISWTVTLEIPHVSFYDQDGVIKRNSSKLRRDFETLRPNLGSRVTWEVEKITPKAHAANGINGFTTTKIHFLSYENGKHEIIELTKDLSHAVTQGLLKPSEIDINLMDEKLRFNFPDPDLVIICGKTFSTFGVLPWHIRITEFIHLSTHHDVSHQDFMDILVKHGNCVQRYGK
ncbi:dehydrodolichyl diphosphate synthase complex subunit nus1 [Diachasma alloeum]|uniref:dehydrodolichyl diphosphate synthase complex subunit nus1 n=1 Tax=Diachasma alloeum TaxID=454923 RepID=UPI0007384EC6|nr:dehydrodolichyl diphosphate synthase complex subunit nus1 [Diachasma alloeum]